MGDEPDSIDLNNASSENVSEKGVFIGGWMMPCEIKPISVERQVGMLGRSLRSRLLRYWPEEHFPIFCRDVERFLVRSELALEDVLGCWMDDSHGLLSQELKVRFFFSVLYFMDAQRYIEIGGGSCELSQLVARSRYELGYFDGFLALIGDASVQAKGPLAGGKALKTMREMVGHRLIELISDAPVERIKKQSDAQSFFSKDLWDFVLEKDFGKVVDADNFIERSLRQQGSVRDAYLRRIGKKS